MPQGLKNLPSTVNRVVAYVMHPHRAYETHLFDERLVHSKSEEGLRKIEFHIRHFGSCVADSGRLSNVRQIAKVHHRSPQDTCSGLHRGKMYQRRPIKEKGYKIMTSSTTCNEFTLIHWAW